MCSTGSQNRSRLCDLPQSRFDGKDCVGDGNETQSCNTEPCPSKFKIHFGKVYNINNEKTILNGKIVICLQQFEQLLRLVFLQMIDCIYNYSCYNPAVLDIFKEATTEGIGRRSQFLGHN